MEFPSLNSVTNLFIYFLFFSCSVGLDLVLELPKQPNGIALRLRQLRQLDLVHYDEHSYSGKEEEAGGELKSEKQCSTGYGGQSPDFGHWGWGQSDHVDGVEKQSVLVIVLLADVVVRLNMINDYFEDHIQFRFDEIVCVRL